MRIEEREDVVFTVLSSRPGILEYSLITMTNHGMAVGSSRFSSYDLQSDRILLLSKVSPPQISNVRNHILGRMAPYSSFEEDNRTIRSSRYPAPGEHILATYDVNHRRKISYCAPLCRSAMRIAKCSSEYVNIYHTSPLNIHTWKLCIKLSIIWR